MPDVPSERSRAVVDRALHRPPSDLSTGTRPTVGDKLTVMVHRMTDAELRAAIGRMHEHGERFLTEAESVLLVALMAEEARRAR